MKLRTYTAIGLTIGALFLPSCGDRQTKPNNERASPPPIEEIVSEETRNQAVIENIKELRDEKLEYTMEELLATATQAASDFYGGSDVLVRQLSQGKEINWEYVRTLAIEDTIDRDTAFSALKSCLEIKIPEYRANSTREISPGDYWESRAIEAEKALADLQDSKKSVVVYRGIPLLEK